MQLADIDRELAAGTPAQRLAMRVLQKVGVAAGARKMLDVTAAHIDGCLYHGQAGLDFARRLVAGGARVRVPTTLNVASLDLLHPELYRGDPETAHAARQLMAAYEEMGCRATWTCAPYQLPVRPQFGEHVAWAESNAIVFANSVLGARTDRYGDFIDICAAITGRAPAAGLHLEENRRARFLFTVADIPDPVPDLLYPALGHVIGRQAGLAVAAVAGLEHAAPTEDDLKALGAAAASSGGVALVHVLGATPEARRGEVVAPDATVARVGADDLRAAVSELTSGGEGPVDAIALGTPHYSRAQLEHLAAAVGGRELRLPVFVSTGRDVLAGLQAHTRAALEGAGVTLVTDTCTYVTPILTPGIRCVMTDSAKWAYYAPGNLGVTVIFGSLEDCLATAERGVLVRSGWPLG